MPDYEKMYFELFRKVESAIKILGEAQLDGEKLFLDESEKDNVIDLRKVSNK